MKNFPFFLHYSFLTVGNPQFECGTGPGNKRERERGRASTVLKMLTNKRKKAMIGIVRQMWFMCTLKLFKSNLRSLESDMNVESEETRR